MRGLKEPFLSFDGFIFDLDGTVYLGDALLPGAKEVIRGLRHLGKKVVFLSNKPLQRREEYAQKLSRLGIPAGGNDVINSSYVMARFLNERVPEAGIYCIGEPPLLAELEAWGLRIVTDPAADYESVGVVVAAFDRTFDYAKLCHAYEAIKRGARFFATNPDRTCPVGDTELPDCASVIAAIEACTGREVEVVVGKPNPLMLTAAAEGLGVPPERCLMLGDRLETDIRMATEAGVTAAVVLTGVADRRDVATWSSEMPQWAPQFVLEGVYEMLA